MNILFVGAHPDDVEMGASGLLVKMSEKAECRVLVFSDCEEQPGNQGISQEFQNAMSILGVKESKLLNFPNTRLPEKNNEIRQVLEETKKEFNPDIVVIHDIDTLHQDHRTVSEECLRVFRNSSVLMYEDMKSVENFKPNLIVSLTPEQFNKKLQALDCYKTQERRYYYDLETIKSLARVRGKQMNAEIGEAYKIHRFIYR
ncbi:MAG: PIG-L family deacetylase [Nanoarchaeota archaeon]|nr:PIG-L family deacetylase [Nanoarchaeota archaeon]MBU1135188.1 PIG-L family deacetylase [Nanoarchaeota archaeon]MBU2519948.1 PIG-L family deacetylase [Nanoarchaeota archaeon]